MPLLTEPLITTVGEREAVALREEALNLLESTVATFREMLPEVSFHLAVGHAKPSDPCAIQIPGMGCVLQLAGGEEEFRRRIASILCAQLSAHIRALNNLAQIRQAKREWEVSADLLEDEIYLIDPHSVIHRLNRKAALRLGTKPQDQIGQRINGDIFGGDHVLKAALPNGGRSTNQYMLHVDARYYDVRIYGVQWGQNLPGYILVRSDRTDDIAAQQAQLRTARLAGLGQVSLGLAHELNNPLGIILTAAGRLERRHGDNQDVAEMSRVISREVERCRRITHALLDYGRAPDRHPSIVSLPRILKLLPQRLSASFPQHRIRVRARGQTDVLGHPDDLLRLFSNLLANACDACEPHDEILVSLRRDKGKALVSVANPGPPIPAHIEKRIFQPFFTTKGHGTGLGLAFALRIVEMLQGTIWYERRDPCNIFHVRLPIVKAEP